MIFRSFFIHLFIQYIQQLLIYSLRKTQSIVYHGKGLKEKAMKGKKNRGQRKVGGWGGGGGGYKKMSISTLNSGKC